MKRIIRAIKTAFVVGYIDFKKPSFMTESTLKTLLDLFTFLMKVAEEKKPYMTSIMINIEKPVELVSLWAGAGAETIKEIITSIRYLKIRRRQVNKLLMGVTFTTISIIILLSASQTVRFADYIIILYCYFLWVSALYGFRKLNKGASDGRRN